MKLKAQFRSATIETGDDYNVFKISFASDEPYERAWGIEILDHSKESVDLTRLKRSAPLLFNHDLDEVIGVVEDAWVEANKSYATIRFGNSGKAKEVVADVRDGILKNVSVGYQILKAVEESSKDGKSVYRVTEWQPFEISIVSVPADTSVGFGRKFDEEHELELKSKEKEMSTEEMNKEAPQVEEQRSKTVDVKKVEREVREHEMKRIAEIQAIGDKFEQNELARQFIENGGSVDEFRSVILEKIGANTKDKVSTVKANEEIGLTEKEARSFSFIRALNALANPQSKRAQEAAKFELEVSEAAQRAAGIQAQGILVPFDVLNRSLTAGGAGSATVPTDVLSGDFIELLRTRSAVMNQATIMTGLSGNIAIPRQNAALSINDLAETDTSVDSDLGLDQVTMTPRRVGGGSSYSKQLLAQSSVDVENLIRNDLLQQIALHIDNRAILGDGTANQPTGLLNQTGVNLVEIGTDGGALEWQHIVAMESAIAEANADIGSMSYLVNAKTNGYMKTKTKVAGYPEYLIRDGQTNGYDVRVSNQMPQNLTKGAGTGLSAIAFGNWQEMVIGFWGGVDLVVDPYSQKKNGLIEVQADQFYDVAIRHPEAFSVIKDAQV